MSSFSSWQHSGQHTSSTSPWASLATPRMCETLGHPWNGAAVGCRRRQGAGHALVPTFCRPVPACSVWGDTTPAPCGPRAVKVRPVRPGPCTLQHQRGHHAICLPCPPQQPGTRVGTSQQGPRKGSGPHSLQMHLPGQPCSQPGSQLGWTQAGSPVLQPGRLLCAGGRC